MSADIEPKRSPALFLEFLPSIDVEGSRRLRFTGRTVDAVMDRSLAEFGGCLELGGGFFADIKGDGEDVEEETPFVWMPGGTGLFALVAPFCCAATGAMVARMAGGAGPRVKSQNSRPSPATLSQSSAQ